MDNLLWLFQKLFAIFNYIIEGSCNIIGVMQLQVIFLHQEDEIPEFLT